MLFLLIAENTAAATAAAAAAAVAAPTTTTPVLVPGHVSTVEIRKEYFEERPVHLSLQISTDEEFTASSFYHLLARHDGRESKSDRTTVWVHGPGFTSC